VAVQVEPASPQLGPSADVAWELETARGLVLRVRAGLSRQELDRVLAFLGELERRP